MRTKCGDKLRVSKDLKGRDRDLSKITTPTFVWKGRGKVDKTSVWGSSGYLSNKSKSRASTVGKLSQTELNGKLQTVYKFNESQLHRPAWFRHTKECTGTWNTLHTSSTEWNSVLVSITRNISPLLICIESGTNSGTAFGLLRYSMHVTSAVFMRDWKFVTFSSDPV